MSVGKPERHIVNSEPQATRFNDTPSSKKNSTLLGDL